MTLRKTLTASAACLILGSAIAGCQQKATEKAFDPAVGSTATTYSGTIASARISKGSNTTHFHVRLSDGSMKELDQADAAHIKRGDKVFITQDLHGRIHMTKKAATMADETIPTSKLIIEHR